MRAYLARLLQAGALGGPALSPGAGGVLAARNITDWLYGGLSQCVIGGLRGVLRGKLQEGLHVLPALKVFVDQVLVHAGTPALWQRTPNMMRDEACSSPMLLWQKPFQSLHCSSECCT